MDDAAKSEPSIGTLLNSLVRDTGVLVRQEIQLASTEMGQKAKSATLQIGVAAMGGALAHAGLLALIAAVILGLGTLIPVWVSALIIGLVTAGAGLVLVRKGITALRELDPVPKRTVETLQQDRTWMKEQLR